MSEFTQMNVFDRLSYGAFGECATLTRSEEEVMNRKMSNKTLPVVMRLRDTPVPIPNTMVKT